MKNIALIFALFLFMGEAFSQPVVETQARITDITVYTAAAEIHYEKQIALEKGKNRIVFTGLTTAIVPNTINIRCEDPSVGIITVTDKINYIKEQKTHSERVAEYRDSIARINDDLGLLAVRIDALNAEKNLLFKNSSIGGVEDGVAVSEIEKAADFFQKRYLDIVTNLYKLKRTETKLKTRIDHFNRQMNQVTTPVKHSTSEVMVIVNSPARKTVKFDLKLLTDKGGWSPLYDFKYNGSDQPLNFVFRANVFNASGIAWNDVNLKLSTADPIRGFALPSLNNNTQAPPVQPINQGGREVKFKQVQVSNVIAEYKIKHKYTVPSDAKPYLVEVDKYEMNSGFSYLMIPKLDPFGFLMAEIPNWNQYNLIPGTTNIYNKGTYMGKTFLQTYAPTDTLSVYLGKDQGIQATRTEKNEHHPRNIVGNYAIDKTNINILIKNNGPTTMRIKVMDHLPVIADNDKVKLNINEISNAEHDQSDGMLYWSFNIAAGETIPLDIRYELKAPKEAREALRSKASYFRTISCPSF